MEVLSGMDRILVIQTAFIGDAVLTLPMIAKLKEIFSESAIDVIAVPSTSEIFEASPFVDEVMVLDKRGEHKSVSSSLKFAESLKSKNYVRVYSPHRSLRTSLIVKKINAPQSFGFTNSSYKKAYKYLIGYNPNAHEVQRNFDLIGWKYSGDEWKITPQIKVPENTVKKMDNFFVNYKSDKNIIAVAPGSVWKTKRYPEKYYAEVIRRLLNLNYSVILIGGKSDAKLCKNIAGKFEDSGIYSTAGRFSLIESIELLKRAELLISNDSAPTHLGMCADIPVLTIFCSTVAVFGFAPYNSKSRFISQDDLYCKPCGIHGYDKCPIGTFECGTNLEPDIIIPKIEEMLNDKS